MSGVLNLLILIAYQTARTARVAGVGYKKGTNLTDHAKGDDLMHPESITPEEAIKLWIH